MIKQPMLWISETSDLKSLVLFPTEAGSPELEKDTDTAQLICEALSALVAQSLQRQPLGILCFSVGAMQKAKLQ